MMHCRRVSAALLGMAMLGVLGMTAGCGERPQVIQYKQGTYQGKPDARPYESAPFNGNRQEWDNALKARAQSQNEYNREM